MSHLKERKEKACLNCGAAIYGRYCHICGQENIETKESFWHLVKHFIEDITHFDGKFFNSLKYLLFKPGFLTTEYLRGKRSSYLHPIRMYIFTSVFFFLIYFSFYQKNEIGNNQNAQDTKIGSQGTDTAVIKKRQMAKYSSLKGYDSIQANLPETNRDGFIIRKLSRQIFIITEKYNNDLKLSMLKIFENALHHFPKLLFLFLPFFAALLKIIYLRNKNLFYINHAIYTLHLFCGTFIIILLNLWIGYIFNGFHTKEPGWISFLTGFAGFYYWYKSQRNYYAQSRRKTIIKYCLIMFISFILLVLLFIPFFIYSSFTI